MLYEKKKLYLRIKIVLLFSALSVIDTTSNVEKTCYRVKASGLNSTKMAESFNSTNINKRMLCPLIFQHVVSEWNLYANHNKAMCIEKATMNKTLKRHKILIQV